jgi:hypothetical protein
MSLAIKKIYSFTAKTLEIETKKKIGIVIETGILPNN